MSFLRPYRSACFAACCSLLASCADPSVSHSESFDWHVVNGAAFDRATVDLAGVAGLIVPEGATVLTGAPPNQLILSMKKRLNFAGHPSSFVTIDDERHKMGCAVRRDGATLTVATFGEWNSHIEGGADIELILFVPAALKPVKSPGLSGITSAAVSYDLKALDHQAAALNPGWQRVADQPDPVHSQVR